MLSALPLAPPPGWAIPPDGDNNYMGGLPPGHCRVLGRFSFKLELPNWKVAPTLGLDNDSKLLPPKHNIWLAVAARLFGCVELRPELDVRHLASQLQGGREQRMTVTQLGNPCVQVIHGKVLERAEDIGRQNVFVKAVLREK